MDAEEVIQLAFVLRSNGDKVLNGQGKLSLSTSLLNTLNGSFNLVTEQRDSLSSSFQVISSNTNVEIFSDLQFLHDFIQRSVSLKLIPGTLDGADEAVDISFFKNLKFLELHKVNADSVLGMQHLRPRLQFLVCVRSIHSLKDILEECGGDKSAGFLWNDLKEAIFSHNEIYALDNSLEFAPWLHTLDLSHNNIKCATQLNCLSNLKNLNLSYNKLEAVPEFNGQLCSRLQVTFLCLFSDTVTIINSLQVLVLKSNFIEDLKNLAILANLCELDLGDNCLLEHKNLSPISYLAALKCLNLDGNPLSYHPQHRMKTISYLHINTNTVRFLLDGVIVTKSEQRLVGTLHCAQMGQQRFLASYNSIASDTSTLVSAERPKRVRDATITEDDPCEVKVSPASAYSLTTSIEHLETKRQIKELREKYGESWLQQQAGSQLQEALGLEKTPMPVTSSPYEAEFLLHAKEFHSETNNKEKAEITSEQSNNTFVTAAESVISDDNSVYARRNDGSSSEEEVDLGDGDESIYLVTKRGEGEELFVVITKNRIYERDCITSKVKAHWHIESLTSCELTEAEEDVQRCVKLEFETLRKDKKQREYVLEKEEAERLTAVLKQVIENKPPDDSILVYQCMKCSHTFSLDKTLNHRKGPLECPACESTLVIEHEN